MKEPSRAVLAALHDPHDASERFDPEFLLLTRCLACGKEDYVPRKLIREANRAHAEECPERFTAESLTIQVLYPPQ